MKKVMLIVFFVSAPALASAAAFTLDDVLGIFPSFGKDANEKVQNIPEFLKILDKTTGTSVETVVEKKVKVDKYPSHSNYIKQLMFPGNKNASTTPDIADIAARMLGEDVEAKLDCLKVEFAGSWRRGSIGEEVRELQKFLNQNSRTQIAKSGPGSPGKETQYFGTLTHKAVKRFQQLFAKDILSSVGLSKATGLWGPSTRKKANEITSLCK